MSPYLVVTLAFVVVIAIVVAGFLSWRAAHREKPKTGLKEGYGPPPGWYPALSPDQLGDRGWVSWPYEYNGNTASSVSHMIERSA